MFKNLKKSIENKDSEYNIKLIIDKYFNIIKKNYIIIEDYKVLKKIIKSIIQPNDKFIRQTLINNNIYLDINKLINILSNIINDNSNDDIDKNKIIINEINNIIILQLEKEKSLIDKFITVYLIKDILMYGSIKLWNFIKSLIDNIYNNNSIKNYNFIKHNFNSISKICIKILDIKNSENLSNIINNIDYLNYFVIKFNYIISYNDIFKLINKDNNEFIKLIFDNIDKFNIYLNTSNKQIIQYLQDGIINYSQEKLAYKCVEYFKKLNTNFNNSEYLNLLFNDELKFKFNFKVNDKYSKIILDYKYINTANKFKKLMKYFNINDIELNDEYMNIVYRDYNVDLVKAIGYHELLPLIH